MTDLATIVGFYASHMPAIFNICTRKVGGLRFIKIGRLCISFSITREYRPL